MRLRAALALAFAALLPPTLCAQEKVMVAEIDGRQVATMKAFVVAGSDDRTGLGFVDVEVENPDERTHDVEVEVGTRHWGTGNVHVSRALTLGPHERARFFLPLPSPLVASALVLRVDGDERFDSLGGGRRPGLVGLFVTERLELQPQALTWLTALPQGYDARTTPQVAGCPPLHLPGDWRLFTAFDCVLVDGTVALAEAQQDALRRYAAVGGTVLVGGPAALPAGPLRRLLERAGDEPIAHGFGQLLALPAFGAGSGAGSATAAKARVGDLPPFGFGPLPAESGLLAVQDVPGLGDAPVRGFVLIIVLFAIVAGPVNFTLLKRRKRPLLVLLTVPALGFGTTMLLLGYGLVQDGFGVRGTASTWTWLDQPQREGATLAARTLFAGFAPGAFALGNDSVLLTERCAMGGDFRDGWQLDAASFALDGGVLPSRTSTPLLSVQQGPVRARLLVREQADGTLQLLPDGGIEAEGQVVLCDLQGRWWTGQAPVLRRTEAAVAAAAVENLQRDAGMLEVPQIVGDDGQRAPAARIGRLEQRLRVAGAGGYLLRSKRAPWLADHGVPVAYDAERHYVAGRLAAEDFVR